MMKLKHDVARSREWWIAALLLSLPLSGSGFGTDTWEPALLGAGALVAAEVAVLLRRDSVPDPLEVQVRMIFVLLLVIGSVPPFGPLHLLLTLIAVVRLILGRCLLSAVLRLAPWNESVPALGQSS